MAAMSTVISTHHPSSSFHPSVIKVSKIVSSHQEPSTLDRKNHKPASRLAESFSHLLHLTSPTPPRKDLIHFTMLEEKQSTPAMSPKGDISKKWHEIHGFTDDWESILDPLDPWLRREIIKYGEFAQATYDAFDFDSFSEYCGSCRYNKNKIFKELGLAKHGYKVTRYLYALSHIDVPRWLERTSSNFTDAWSKDSNWMGYVAVSDDEESRRIGRRDIVVAWRGTVAPCEWYEDFQRKLEPIGKRDAKVEHGFLSIYTSKCEKTRYNRTSASEQVMKEVKRLINFYNHERGEQVSITITGHSLGGALALLNAYEAASLFPEVPISVISFGAPRVGNGGFRAELEELGVKTLRVVVKQDLVPKMPGIMFNESLEHFDDFTGTLEWVYTHVGSELKLDVHSSPFLKRNDFNLTGIHSLETYLHLVDGFLSSNSEFRINARRDVALVNKACDMLVEELRIPRCWYQLANKGLVCNGYGRWIKPRRDPEDIPSPTSTVEGGHGLLDPIEIHRYGSEEATPLYAVKYKH